jgi:hypothetical protein
MSIEVPKQWTDAVDSRAWLEIRHVDQTVYGLASVNVWFILRTPDVNEVKHRERAPELVYSCDVMRLTAEPRWKSVNPTVYGLASVDFCILLTLHVNSNFEHSLTPYMPKATV